MYTKTVMEFLKRMNEDRPTAVQREFREWVDTYDSDLEDLGFCAPGILVRAFLEHAKSPLTQQFNLVDAGIGTGWLPQELRKNGANPRVIGLDLTWEMLQACKANADTEGGLIRCNVGEGNWPISDESIDGVLACGLSEHLESKNLETFLEQSNRVLKPNGPLFFTFTHSEDEDVKVTPRVYRPSFYSYNPDFISGLSQRYGFSTCAQINNFHAYSNRDGEKFFFSIYGGTKTSSLNL